MTNKCDDAFGGLGATAIDALSTAILMENEEVVLQILEFIAVVDFTRLADHNTKIQSFEVIIRHFGGMISAYDLLNGPFDTLAEEPTLRKRLLEQIVALGDILACSFNTGPLQIPRGWVDPVQCITDSATTNTIAGIGTMVLEFARLSAITGNPKYVKLAEEAEQYLIDAQLGDDSPFPGLLGSQINIKDGQMANQVGGWGAPSDSYYEYLIKAYIYDQRRYASYLEPWQLAVDSTIQFIGSSPWGYANWTLLPTWTEKVLSRSMDSLSWFAGGNFILGGMVTKNQTVIDYGLSIADTAGAIYSMTATGLGPEYVSWKTECDPEDDGMDCKDPRTSVTFTDTHFKLRPEVLETWYYAYRATHDPKYRAWAWAAFQAIRKFCQTASGFSAIGNVDAADGGTKLDMQESFVFAEVLKYIYLIHSRVSMMEAENGCERVLTTFLLLLTGQPSLSCARLAERSAEEHVGIQYGSTSAEGRWHADLNRLDWRFAAWIVKICDRTTRTLKNFEGLN